MRNIHWLILAVVISTGTLENGEAYWALFGKIDSASETLKLFGVTPASQDVIIRSTTTPDCYQLFAYPNGTPYTKWVVCPK